MQNFPKTKTYKLKPHKRGFTLLELLIVIGIIAVLVAVAIIAINPAQQFAKANNARRMHDLRQIVSAIQQNMINSRGPFVCEPFPTDPVTGESLEAIMRSSTTTPPVPPPSDPTAPYYDICNCLVPTYLPAMPVDPQRGGYESCTNYNTEYTIQEVASLLLRAPHTQIISGIQEEILNLTLPGQITVKGCLTGYPDSDGDGYYSSSGEKICQDTLPPGYSLTPGNDCCDSDANTNPGQTGWFTVPNNCGNYDYNCDASETLQYTTLTTCPSTGCFPNGVDCLTGWVSPVPTCGSSLGHRVCSLWAGGGTCNAGTNWGYRTGFGESCKESWFFVDIYDISSTQACR